MTNERFEKKTTTIVHDSDEVRPAGAL